MFIGKPGILVFYIAIDTPIASKIRDDHASRAAKQRFDGRAKKSHKKHGFLNMTINWTGTKGLMCGLEEELVYTHYSKSQIFVQKFNFDQNHNIFASFSPNFFDNFSREIKVVNS